MNEKLTWLGLLLAAVGAWACVPLEDPSAEPVSLELDRAAHIHLLDLQDRQEVDSLLAYFSDEHNSYRYLAALAMASIQDSRAVDSLLTLLEDPLDSVRMAAAYALGQIGDSTAAPYLARAFEQWDTLGQFPLANAAILEAVGKCAPGDYLAFMASVQNYEPSQSWFWRGVSRGVYQFGLRGITLPEATANMVKLALSDSFDIDVRLMAAHHLSRSAPPLTEESQIQALIMAFTRHPDPRLRMALAIAAGKTGHEDALEALRFMYSQEQDYRVRCNIMRALVNFDYEKAAPIARMGLKDPHLQVANRAASFFLDRGTGYGAYSYRIWAADSLPWQVSVTLARATMRHLPQYDLDTRRSYSYKLRFQTINTQDPYEKAALMTAVAEHPWNYRFLSRDGIAEENHPAVRTAAMRGLAYLAYHPDFISWFGGGHNRVSAEFAKYFKEGIQSGDPGLITEAAIGLRNEDRAMWLYLDSLEFIDEAIQGLELPREVETLRELEHTKAFLLRENWAPSGPPAYNHPVKWQAFPLDDSISVRLATSKGDIILAMRPQDAPATVINFLDLVQQGFYDGKNFHRVVPNFVIQGGGTRGDGYGSLDYTIRSELPPVRYDQEGMVGMASAGNHTECTQFFITHSPTPHLEGGYTIFAEVVSGMEVVHQITQGDLIRSATILNLN